MDTAPPSCGNILDGPSFDRDFIGPTMINFYTQVNPPELASSSNAPTAHGLVIMTWNRFTDLHSGIVSYAAGIIPQELRTTHDSSSLTDVGMLTSATFNVSLRHGYPYYSVVKATDRVGQSSYCYSNSFFFDATPPLPWLTGCTVRPSYS